MKETGLLPFHILIEVSLNIFPHVLGYHGDRHPIKTVAAGSRSGLISIKPTNEAGLNPQLTQLGFSSIRPSLRIPYGNLEGDLWLPPQ